MTRGAARKAFVVPSVMQLDQKHAFTGRTLIK
jgi:hypothetical protein